MSNISFLEKNGLNDISGELLLENGKMKLLSYKEYEKYSHNDLRAFCHQYTRYGIPTLELVEWLKLKIGSRKAIEIGSGSGDLGYHLGIPMTDSKQQNIPMVKEFYEIMGQPTINYPDDVHEIDALEAVKYYKPEIVIASWVTPYSSIETSYSSNPRGIKEDKILFLVDTYILIGNIKTHGDRPICKEKHEQVADPYLISRSSSPDLNRVFIWGGL